MRGIRVLGTVLGLALVLIGGCVVWASRHSEIPPVLQDPSAIDADLAAKGAALAALGNCNVCHTRPGGEPYAGGLPLPTPFGTIVSANITPDPETGIGLWSEEALWRALHAGIDREGGHLYPAFPYDHYTKVADDDVRAIHAHLMTQKPVRAQAPENELPFPLNIRLLIAGWNLLFLDQGVYEPDPSKDERWNRGAYLVQGLGHCGSCHSPRNALGAVKADVSLSGGEAEAWHAPALDASSPAPVPWTEDALVNYLMDGWDEDHGAAAGPMAPVVGNLSGQAEEDVAAMAHYIASLQAPSASGKNAEEARAFAEQRQFGAPGTGLPGTDPALRRGEDIFARACAGCHRSGSRTVPLALTSAVAGPDPRNLIHVVMVGIKPPAGMPGHSMPAFGTTLSAENLIDLVTFVRARFSRGPAWENVRERVEKIRLGQER